MSGHVSTEITSEQELYRIVKQLSAAMVFEKSEIASLDVKVISALNSLTILYNSCDVALSVLALFIIWSGLINGKKWAFWALLIIIGFVEISAFIASAPIGNARWPVNVVQSVLYVVGIGLSGWSLFKSKEIKK